MKPLQKERDEMSKKLGEAQWDIQTKQKEIVKLENEIKELKELVEFYNNALNK